jgi:chemotaxis protein MotB
MAKEAPIIVVKKIVAGHAGAHGGAWKVAYADFVTAMMCFFLVMWLMGADEDTKAEISHYFNHPNTPWRQGRDPDSQSAHPMGERAGAGDSILKGADGEVPESMVSDPVRPVSDALSEYTDLKSKIQSELDAVAYGMDISMDTLRFSVAEEELFAGQSVDLRSDAGAVLDKIGKVLSRFPGFLNIEAHIDDESAGPGGLSAYEFTMARAVSVMHYFVHHSYMQEERISPMGRGSRRPYSKDHTDEGVKKNRRIEFILSRSQNL